MKIEFVNKGTSISLVKDFFSGVPVELRKKVLTRAIRAGAMVIVKEARRRAPVDTGFLRDQINARRPRRAKRGVVEYIIDTGEAFYGYFVELGYLKQPVLSLPSGRLISIRAPKDKRKEIPPRPFMRPAFEASADESMKVIAESVRDWTKLVKVKTKVGAAR